MVSALAGHFYEEQHQEYGLDPIEFLKVTIVDKAKNDAELKNLENHYIEKLQTMNHGLNRLKAGRAAKADETGTGSAAVGLRKEQLQRLTKKELQQLSGLLKKIDISI